MHYSSPTNGNKRLTNFHWLSNELVKYTRFAVAWSKCLRLMHAVQHFAKQNQLDFDGATLKTCRSKFRTSLFVRVELHGDGLRPARSWTRRPSAHERTARNIAKCMMVFTIWVRVFRTRLTMFPSRPPLFPHTTSVRKRQFCKQPLRKAVDVPKPFRHPCRTSNIRGQNHWKHYLNIITSCSTRFSMQALLRRTVLLCPLPSAEAPTCCFKGTCFPDSLYGHLPIQA